MKIISLILAIVMLIVALFCYVKRDHILPDVSDSERERYNIYNIIEKIGFIIGGILLVIFFILL